MVGSYEISPVHDIPHVVVTPTIKLLSLLLHNYNLVTVLNLDVNIFGDRVWLSSLGDLLFAEEEMEEKWIQGRRE
ncbi:hypothetical protein STEG23_003181, partial [Scotinomys teguina]